MRRGPREDPQRRPEREERHPSTAFREPRDRDLGEEHRQRIDRVDHADGALADRAVHLRVGGHEDEHRRDPRTHESQVDQTKPDEAAIAERSRVAAGRGSTCGSLPRHRDPREDGCEHQESRDVERQEGLVVRSPLACGDEAADDAAESQTDEGEHPVLRENAMPALRPDQDRDEALLTRAVGARPYADECRDREGLPRLGDLQIKPIRQGVREHRADQGDLGSETVRAPSRKEP